MDVEPIQNHNNGSSSTSSNRFALKNSIQTNFGDDYVFQIVHKYVNPKFNLIAHFNFNSFYENIMIELNFNVFNSIFREDWTSMAVSLSSNTVKLYSPVTGQYVGECGKHSDTINHILLSGNDILYSCSTDGTLRAWDTRSYQQVIFICYS